MARHKGGWVKLWRQAALGDIGSSFLRLGLFNALLCMANIQISTISWRGKPRRLERGEILTSIKELADLGDVDRSTILRHINYLVLRGTIKLEKSNKGVLIKILNYDKYQELDAGSPHQAQHRAPHPPHIRHHIDRTLNEEVKKKRSKEVICTEVESKLSSFGAIQQFENDAFVKDFLINVSKKSQESWLKLYPVEYVTREIVKADEWLSRNPRRAPKSTKGWSTFMTSWLNRGWGSYQKNIPVNLASSKTHRTPEEREALRRACLGEGSSK